MSENRNAYKRNRAEQEGVSHLYKPLRESGKEGSLEYVYSNGSKYNIQITESEFREKYLDITFTGSEGGRVQLMSYLPKPWKLILDRNRVDPMWCSYTHDKIVLNKLPDPKSMLAVLHEMGHAIIYSSEMSQEQRNAFINSLLFQSFSGRKTSRAKDFAEEASANERQAWAKALYLARDVKDKTGANILEAFSTVQDLQNFLYSNLTDHRYGWEFDLTREAHENSKIEIGFLSKLFDKGKLKRNLKE